MPGSPHIDPRLLPVSPSSLHARRLPGPLRHRERALPTMRPGLARRVSKALGPLPRRHLVRWGGGRPFSFAAISRPLPSRGPGPKRGADKRAALLALWLWCRWSSCSERAAQRKTQPQGPPPAPGIAPCVCLDPSVLSHGGRIPASRHPPTRPPDRRPSGHPAHAGRSRWPSRWHATGLVPGQLRLTVLLLLLLLLLLFLFDTPSPCGAPSKQPFPPGHSDHLVGPGVALDSQWARAFRALEHRPPPGRRRPSPCSASVP